MRKDQAQRLMNDPDLKESFSLLRDKLRVDFENAPITDKDGLQIIRLKYELIREYYQELMKVVNESTVKDFKRK